MRITIYSLAQKSPGMRCIRTFEGHKDDVYSVSFSPDGRYAISGSEDYTLKLWDVASGECIRTFEGHEMGVYSVSFSPDGRYVISGSLDETLKLWDIATGKCIRTFEGHKKSVNSISFSPDGRYVLSGSDDGTLKLWDVATGECIRTFKGYKGVVTSVSFSPDGRYALSGGGDNILKLWVLDWELEEKEPADWDEGARAYLEIFLTLHTPYGPDGLTRQGKPQWTEQDFKKLLQELGYRGYGWLRPEGVRRKLEEMGRRW